jgi:hypothetical protein
VLSRPWTSRTIHECCLLAFGTADPERPSDRKLIAQDPWLRFTIMRFLMERAWGRAPLEVKFEATQYVNVYTQEQLSRLTLEQISAKEQLSRLTLEQISAIWREQIAAPAGITDQSDATDGGRGVFAVVTFSIHWWSRWRWTMSAD